MSVTYSLYCENGERLFVGQGSIPYLYGTNEEVKKQHEFLLRNISKKIILECDETFSDFHDGDISKMFT